MEEKTKGIIDIIIDENKNLINSVKHHLDIGDFYNVVDDIFRIKMNKDEVFYVCEKEKDKYGCFDYAREAINEQVELTFALKEKCK